MAIDAWLPVGYLLPDGARTRVALFEGPDWQVLETQGKGRALLAREGLAERWFDSGLIEPTTLQRFDFGREAMFAVSSGPSQVLCPVVQGESPNTKAEAIAFAQSLRATRGLDPESPLQDAVYVEKLSRLLPTYGISSTVADDVVFGYWLTGGAPISVLAFRRLAQAMSWLGTASLSDVLREGGFQTGRPAVARERSEEATVPEEPKQKEAAQSQPEVEPGDQFRLPGRPELEAFFNEHVVDIIQNRDRYSALGIHFPGAIVLHGPPGCGKTFAVETLVEFLGWPSFAVDASSVASPYIHETSKKVAEVFDKAIKSGPSVLVIDEMEAFLADREIGSGASHHRVEEVAEFLRRIPEAQKNEVLIVGMTNRVEMIDPAILRRGRFDHVIKVDFAQADEVQVLLESLFASLPIASSVQVRGLAEALAGRPLSDVAFVVREGARLAARAGKERLDGDSLSAALRSAPARIAGGGSERRIGFV